MTEVRVGGCGRDIWLRARLDMTGGLGELTNGWREQQFSNAEIAKARRTQSVG